MLFDSITFFVAMLSHLELLQGIVVDQNDVFYLRLVFIGVVGLRKLNAARSYLLPKKHETPERWRARDGHLRQSVQSGKVRRSQLALQAEYCKHRIDFLSQKKLTSAFAFLFRLFRMLDWPDLFSVSRVDGRIFR